MISGHVCNVFKCLKFISTIQSHVMETDLLIDRRLVKSNPQEPSCWVSFGARLQSVCQRRIQYGAKMESNDNCNGIMAMVGRRMV